MNKKTTFKWSGLNPQKIKKSGLITALDTQEAISLLRKQHITPITIQKTKHRSTTKICSKDRAQFFRQLASMINAGLPLIQSLGLAAHQSKEPLKTMIQDCAQDIHSGIPLSQALSKHVDTLTCTLVSVGETAGILDTILNQIAEREEKNIKIKSGIIGALFYPLLTLVVSLIISLGLLLFVIPHFQELYTSFGAKLPWFTSVVLGFSKNLKELWWVFTLIPPFTYSLFLFVKNKGTFINKRDQLFTKIPIIHTALLLTITRTLSDCLQAGVPILQTIELTQKTLSNQCFKTALNHLHTAVSHGQTLSSILKPPLFPEFMIQIISIGEQTGSLDTLLSKLSDTYEGQLEKSFVTIQHLLEPLMMVLLGVFIGSLVVAMYLPVFKLGSVF